LIILHVNGLTKGVMLNFNYTFVVCMYNKTLEYHFDISFV